METKKVNNFGANSQGIGQKIILASRQTLQHLTSAVLTGKQDYRVNLRVNNIFKLDHINTKRKHQITKNLCFVCLLLLNVAPLFAQVDDVTTKLETWSNDIKRILNAAVGIFAIGGGFLIFIQYMQGNEQAQKNFIRFIIGLAIFGLVAFIANIFLPDLD